MTDESLTRLLIAAISILIFAGNLLAQATKTYSAHSPEQTLRSNGRVNPTTLGLEIEIPLSSFSGRGGSVPVSLNYSSKVRRMESGAPDKDPG